MVLRYNSNKVIFIGLDDQGNFYAVEYSRFLYLLALVVVFLKPYFGRVLDGTTKPFLQVWWKVRSQKSYWHQEHQSSVLGSGSIPFFFWQTLSICFEYKAERISDCFQCMGSDDYFSTNSNLLCFVCVCVCGGGGGWRGEKVWVGGAKQPISTIDSACILHK